MIRQGLAIAAAIFVAGAAVSADLSVQVLEFSDLQGWPDDDHQAALSQFLTTCNDMDGREWETLCAVGDTVSAARPFFELFFRPVLIQDDAPMLFTGYFEPELRGSRRKHGPYVYPVYRKPPELNHGELWLSRTQIETGGSLDNRGLEIAWVDDPVELQFLQIQGSGRIRLDDGGSIRLGYSANNGHPYRSVGEELVRRGIYSIHQVSAPVIRAWVQRNPALGAEVMRVNSSYVFFREIKSLGADLGPLGAMNRPIKAGRSIAVDPAFVPLGAPVWIEKQGESPMQRLMIAQDTGSQIKGAQRADIFVGTGDEAGRQAGSIRDGGRMIVLMPTQTAYALERQVTE